MLQTADNLDILINSLHCWVKDYYNDETKIFRKSGNYDLNKTNSTLSKTINITAYNENTLIGCLKILTDSYYFRTQPGVETFYKNTCKKFYNLILLKNEFNYNNIILTRIANYIFLYIYKSGEMKNGYNFINLCFIFIYFSYFIIYRKTQ